VSLSLIPRPRRTKIICTIGPASDDEGMMLDLIEAGMDIARINCSHGDHATRAQSIQRLRRAEKRSGRPLAILLDLAGPKIRTGYLSGGEATLVEGEMLTLTLDEIEGDAHRISVNYKDLPRDSKIGAFVYLADGRLKLEVTAIREREIDTVVLVGGRLGNRKGVNLVGGSISTPPFTEKDRADLEHGLNCGVDIVALSFVRRPSDISPVRETIMRHAATGALGHIPICAKIERPEAIAQLESILDAFDVVMVARGDLGVEVGPAGIPVLQKNMIRKAIQRSRPVIVATEMLESMITAPRPSRAEVSDVANAVFDGADTVMLSGETASGHDPVLVCRTMREIIDATEASTVHYEHLPRPQNKRDPFHPVGHAAAMLAAQDHVKAICVYTQSGYSARLISAHRPNKPIFAFSPDMATVRRCNCMWGVNARHIEVPDGMTTDVLIPLMTDTLKAEGRVRKDDFVVITARTPVVLSGRTDTIKLHKVV
jgi:pyruvate kinase